MIIHQPAGFAVSNRGFISRNFAKNPGGSQGAIVQKLDIRFAPVERGVGQRRDGVHRRVEGVDGILAHVGADNVRGGEIQAETVMAAYPDGATIMHLQGQPASGPGIDRNRGVHNVLDTVSDKYPIVFEQTANFNRAEGLTVTEAALAGMETPPDVIIAANDDMALGALEAVIGLGLQDQIAIYGFDALPEALASIRDGGLAGSIEQSPGGQSRTAMRIAVLNARGCEYDANPLILLEPVMITADNLDTAERIGEVQ